MVFLCLRISTSGVSTLEGCSILNLSLKLRDFESPASGDDVRSQGAWTNLGAIWAKC